MGNKEYRIQLRDVSTILGLPIIAAGGLVQVCQQGSPAKQTLFDKNGAALANPLVPTRGFINFFIVDTNTAGVDLYVQAPGGQFKVALGVVASGPNEIGIDTSIIVQCAVIPFNFGDVTVGTEFNTGFILPKFSQFLDRLHGCSLNVTTAETTGTKTMDVGTLSSETGGSATGFINASSTATLGQVIGTNGSLFSTNAPANSDANVASHISYTLRSTNAAAQGFIRLPYRNYGAQ